MDAILKDLENRCQLLSAPIVSRLALRVIRRISHQLENTEIDQYLADRGLNVFDQMAIYYQRRSFEDFLFGFEDHLDETIQREMDALPPTERLILDYRQLETLSAGKSQDAIFSDIKAEVAATLDRHYNTVRIQKFMERYHPGG